MMQRVPLVPGLFARRDMNFVLSLTKARDIINLKSSSSALGLSLVVVFNHCYHGIMSFLKYIVVGLVAWLVDVVIYQLLWPVLGIAAGQALARIAGAVTAFGLNKKHTFTVDPRSDRVVVQGLKYGLLLALNWIVTVAFIYIFYRGFGIKPLFAKVMTDVIVVPCNYFVMKFWIFPRGVDERRPIEQGRL